MGEERSAEERAKEIGWIPKEEFRGDPELWTPAEEFLEKGEKYIPFLKKEVKVLRAELDAMKSYTEAELRQVREEGYKAAEEIYRQKIDAIRAEKLKAVEDSDTNAFIAAEKAEAELKPPSAKEIRNADPKFDVWHKNNSWYTPDVSNPTKEADVAMSKFANTLSAQLMSQNPNMKPEELYKAVEDEVKQVFSHKFENMNRNLAPKVEAGGHAPTKSTKKTWSDLPEVAKKAYNRAKARIEQRGGKFTKDEFITQYFESEEQDG